MKRMLLFVLAIGILFSTAWLTVSPSDTAAGDKFMPQTGRASTGIDTFLLLTPVSDINLLSTPHTFTATLLDRNQDPIPGETIVFWVIGGPSAEPGFGSGT